jgi:hypothetical protein
MSRNPLIEAIHEARFDLETCAPAEKASAQTKLNQLLSETLIRSGSRISQRELLDALLDDYREFRKMKRRAGWPHI